MNKYTWLKITLAIACFLFVGYTIDWRRAWETLLHANMVWLSISAALWLVNQGLQTLIWQTLIRKIYPTETFSASMGAVFCGQTLGLFTPARLGDLVGRAYYLKHENKWELAALTGAQQAIAFTCYVGFGIPALLYFLLFYLKLAVFLWYLIFFLGLVVLSVLLTIILDPRGVYQFLNTRFPHPHIQKTIGFLRHLSLKDIYWIGFQTVLRYAVFCSQYILLLWAFDAPITLFHAVIAVVLFYYANSVIPSPALAGLGIREGTSVYFLGAFGVSAAIAFNASLLTYILNIVFPALLGIPFVLKMRLAEHPNTQAIETETSC